MASGTAPLLARWPIDSERGVSSMAISSDGSRLVIGATSFIRTNDEKHAISIWDVHSGRKIAGPLTGHTDEVHSLAYSPDGTRIVSGSSDTTMFVWDAELGEIIFGPLKGDSSILSVTYSPDGLHIFSASMDGAICSWSASTGQLDFLFKTSNGPISSIAFSPDGIFATLGFENGTIRICNLRTRLIVHELSEAHKGGVGVIVYSLDGACIASSSAEQFLWDAHTGQKIAGPLKWHQYVTGISYSPDGAHIVSNSKDGSTHVWDARSGDKLTGSVEAHDVYYFGSCPVLYTPDGTRIISASGGISVWDAHHWE